MGEREASLGLSLSGMVSWPAPWESHASQCSHSTTSREHLLCSALGPLSLDPQAHSSVWFSPREHSLTEGIAKNSCILRGSSWDQEVGGLAWEATCQGLAL